MGDLIPIVAIFFTIGVPVMAGAAHFVLRPLIREIAEAIQGVKVQSGRDVEARLARLEALLEEHDRQLQSVAEVERFHRQLESGRARRRSPAQDRAPA